jgi:hypothetical protein
MASGHLEKGSYLRIVEGNDDHGELFGGDDVCLVVTSKYPEHHWQWNADYQG